MPRFRTAALQKKAPGYRQSAFLLTRSLAEQPSVGTNMQLNRAVKDLRQFSIWSSSEIEQRGEMLVALAARVWKMAQREADSGTNPQERST